MGKVVRILSTAVILAILLSSGITAPVMAEGGVDVTVSISAPGEVAPGSDFTATVDISQVENIDACNYDVSFNPAVLRLDNVTNGTIGYTTIPVTYWGQVLEEPTGTFRIINNVPGVSGVSGSGHLAVLHFHVIDTSGQSSAINLSNGVLSSGLAKEILATWTGGSVQVISTGTTGQGDTTPSPTEPGTTDTSDTTSTTPPPDSGTSDVSDTVSTPSTEAGTGDVSDTVSPTVSESEEQVVYEETAQPSSPPALPSTQSGHINWPVVGGIIGGVIVIGLIVFFQIRSRLY